MGCQKEIVKKIRDKGADYILALKGNQGRLHKDVKEIFGCSERLEHCDFYETSHKQSGRVETRQYWVCRDIGWVRQFHPDWESLDYVGMVQSTRAEGEKPSIRYYIGSGTVSAQEFGQAVRAHWGIENNLHWTLDVTFRDDQCRVRNDNGPENFTIVKHMALNLLNKAKTNKSIAVMRQKATWNNTFLQKPLAT